MGEFHLPDLGSGLKEGELVTWHVQVGQAVTTSDVLCEIETEKAVVEVPVPHDGVVITLAVAEGDTVEVGGLLCVIGDGSGVTADAPDGAGAAPAPTSVPPPDPTNGHRPPPGSRPRAMPPVRLLAKRHGVDLATVTPSGVDGRVTRRDVDAAIAQGHVTRTQAADRPVTDDQAMGRPRDNDDARVERQRMSTLRRSIARHMAEQWATVPHISSNTDVDATRLLQARRALGDRLGRRVPVEAILIAAVLPALRRFPETNATVDGDEVLLRHHYDIGIAVASDGGLLVPVVRDADRLTLAELAERVTDLSVRARSRSLTPDEIGGQTFTISNIGPLGGGHATQILPRGTTAITSFGRLRDQPVVRDGALAIAPVMPLSATFDHRAVDGAPGLGFMTTIVEALEEPALLLA